MLYLSLARANGHLVILTHSYGESNKNGENGAIFLPKGIDKIILNP